MAEQEITPGLWERHACSWYGRSGLLAVLLLGNLWQIHLFLELTLPRVAAAMLLACGEFLLVSWVAHALLEVQPLVPLGRLKLGPISLPGEIPLLVIALLALIWILAAIFTWPPPG